MQLTYTSRFKSFRTCTSQQRGHSQSVSSDSELCRTRSDYSLFIYGPTPSDSRRSKKMPGITKLKNNINVNKYLSLFLNSTFSLYTLVETVVAFSLGLEVGPAAYFVFALLGGLVRNIGIREEICGHCRI